jgi:hypothetical protein
LREIIGSYRPMRLRYVAMLARCEVVNRSIHESTRGWSRSGSVSRGDRSAPGTSLGGRTTAATAPETGRSGSPERTSPAADSAASAPSVIASILRRASTRVIAELIMRVVLQTG